MSSLDPRFYEFHEKNPKVYKQLIALARKAKRGGKERVGIGTLWEVMRWENPDLKLNNSYRSRYARMIMMKEPELQGLFRTRVLKSW